MSKYYYKQNSIGLAEEKFMQINIYIQIRSNFYWWKKKSTEQKKSLREK